MLDGLDRKVALILNWLGYPTMEPFGIGSSLVVTSCFDLCVLCDITDATLLHVCPHRSDYMAPIGQLMMAIGPGH